jgi:hypothetical protein
MDRWTRAQRISTAAFCLRQTTPEDSDEFENKLASEVADYLAEVPSTFEEARPPLIESLRTLPLSTLYLLGPVAAAAVEETSEVEPFETALRESFESLTIGQDALVPSCNILVHHVLHGTTDARGIASLVEQLFKVTRRECVLIGTDRMDRLAELVSALRSDDLATRDRVQCAHELSALVVPDSVERSQIENSLLHHMFCWPLLVSPHTDAPLSVPVAVDALFEADNKHLKRAARRIGRDVYTVGTINIDLDTENSKGHTFASYLARAARAARDLWRKTHGHTGDWRYVIQSVPIVYDFSYASRIAEGVCGGDLALQDGSATAYFAQVILARFLGRDAFLSSAVTGVVGPKVLHRDGRFDLDYELRAVASIPRKLEYVFASQMFERIVIPDVKGLTRAVVSTHRTADVLRAAKLSNVADIVQVLGWRKTHYVRCPDVAWAIHGPKQVDGITPQGIVAKDDREFIEVGKKLAQNDDTVLLLDGVSARAVGSYLWYFNRVVLQELDHVPPSLSWAFIRVAADIEQDASFWRVLWRLAGAPDNDFESFQSCPTPAAALASLTSILNTFAPTRDAKSHRAPDIIVIIGAEQFAKQLDRLHNPAARPLAVPPLLEQLGKPGRLAPSPFSRSGSQYPIFREWIGSTRIICLTEPMTNHRSTERLRLTEDELSVLRRLSTFRSSFGQTTAALVLRDLTFDGESIRGVGVRNVLRQLAKRGVLRYISGEYFLPERVKAAITAQMASESNPDRAQRHFAVGSALAPYWTVTEFPGLAYDAAFIPERVHEAQYHLAEAGRLYNMEGDKYRTKKDAAREAQRQVMRFARGAGWGVAHGLIQSRNQLACKQAYLFAEEFMERWRTHSENKGGLPNHPTHLVAAAKALRHSDPRTPEIPIIADRFWGGASDKSAAIIRLFEQAEANCDAFPAEATYNRLFVFSEFSDYLGSARPPLLKKLESVNAQIRDMQNSWRSCPGAVRGTWFETQGDACRDTRMAATIYADGSRCAQSWHQLKVKGIGALLLARLRDPLIDEVRSLPARDGEDSARKVLAGVMEAIDRDYRKPRDQDIPTFRKERAHIFKRWDSGLSFLLDAWGHYPKLRAMLEDIIRRRVR